MSFINQKIYQHKYITNAILRLNDAFIRHDNPIDSKIDPDFADMFGKVHNKDGNLNKKAIDNIKISGNDFEVAEELYHPSTDIFDIEEQIGVLFYSHKNDNFEYPNDDYDATGSVQATAAYKLRKDERVCAVIKNYHTLHIVDYTVTSLPYPILNEDELKGSAEPTGGRLAHNRFTDNLFGVGYVSKMTWPRIVRYFTAKETEAVITAPEFYGVETVHTLREHNMPVDLLVSKARIYSMSYPVNVGYIKYVTEADQIKSSGKIINMYYNWTT